jgi:3-dehydroquinate synthase
MKKLHVELGDRSYPILVGSGILARAGRHLVRLGFDRPPVVVTNPLVLRLHGKALLTSLQEVFGQVPVVLIGDGERFKNHATLMGVYNGLFRAHADRHSWILAFGGGVVGDVAGFAAATFLRGIPFVGVPTTLLAQVDSSVGGKVGINVARGKNLIGAFHQPSAVLSDTEVLRTLPARELAAGVYEIIKCGAIRSEPLLGYLERKLDAVLKCQPSSLGHIILEAARIKAEVVSGDEREEYRRMSLNFGHTVGHALEAATEYRRFKHGEAVAWGMVAAAEVSSAVIGFPRNEAERLVSLIQRVGSLPTLRGISPAQVWEAMQHDKKSIGGKVRMVLLPRLGRAAIVADLDPSFLRRFLAGFLAAGDGRD